MFARPGFAASPAVVVVFVVASLGFAAPAGARLGNAAYAVATSCNGCHAGATRPILTVTQTSADPLVVGGSVAFRVEITSENAAGVDRFASLSASVLRAAGTFKPVAGLESCDDTGGCPNTRSAVRDIEPRAFVDGRFSWDIEVENLAAGNFNLAVGVNDHNDNGLASGDRNAGTTLAFSVAEGEGEGEGEEGEGEGEGAEGEGEVPPEASCCSGSAAQGSLAGLFLLALRRRQRRRRR